MTLHTWSMNLILFFVVPRITLCYPAVISLISIDVSLIRKFSLHFTIECRSTDRYRHSYCHRQNSIQIVHDTWETVFENKDNRAISTPCITEIHTSKNTRRIMIVLGTNMNNSSISPFVIVSDKSWTNFLLLANEIAVPLETQLPGRFIIEIETIDLHQRRKTKQFHGRHSVSLLNLNTR